MQGANIRMMMLARCRGNEQSQALRSWFFWSQIGLKITQSLMSRICARSCKLSPNRSNILRLMMPFGTPAETFGFFNLGSVALQISGRLQQSKMAQ